MAEERDEKEPDIVLLHSPTEDGEGVHAIRARDNRLEVAEIRPLKEGQPVVAGEVVQLHPRQELPFVCDVEVAHRVEPPGPRGDTAGPPRVSSEAYRKGWDVAFGASRRSRRLRRPKKHELN